MFDLQGHPWMEMLDEDLEKSIQESKAQDEEEKKKAEEEEDLTYLSKLKLESDGSTYSSPGKLDPTDVSSSVRTTKKSKKTSPTAISPRFIKGSSHGNLNGSMKKKDNKGKVVKRKKKVNK